MCDNNRVKICPNMLDWGTEYDRFTRNSYDTYVIMRKIYVDVDPTFNTTISTLTIVVSLCQSVTHNKHNTNETV